MLTNSEDDAFEGKANHRPHWRTRASLCSWEPLSYPHPELAASHWRLSLFLRREFGRGGQKEAVTEVYLYPDLPSLLMMTFNLPKTSLSGSSPSVASALRDRPGSSVESYWSCEELRTSACWGFSYTTHASHPPTLQGPRLLRFRVLWIQSLVPWAHSRKRHSSEKSRTDQ